MQLICKYRLEFRWRNLSKSGQLEHRRKEAKVIVRHTLGRSLVRMECGSDWLRIISSGGGALVLAMLNIRVLLQHRFS